MITGYLQAAQLPAAGRPRRGPPAEPRPWLTIALLTIIIGIWIAMTVNGGSLDATERSMALLKRWGAAARPALWYSRQPWRLFTAVFIHFGFIHLAMNSLSLWWVGRPVEQLFGGRRMLYIFLVAGVAGSAASAVLGLPVVISAGASGAIFGLLGAIIWYRLSSPLGERIAWRPLLVTVGLNLGLGLALSNIVDNWNHIGGLVGGMLAAAVVGVPAVSGLGPPRFRPPRSLRLLMAGALILGGIAVLTGAVELPGRGRELARALTLLEAGRPREAEPEIRRAAVQQPDEPTIRAWLVLTYATAGDCERAAGELNQLLTLAPDHAAVQTAELQQAISECQSNRP